jgi:prephenate dehydrogenase
MEIKNTGKITPNTPLYNRQRNSFLKRDIAIGIIGGAGVMGSNFLRILKNLGFTNLHLSDLNHRQAQEIVQKHGFILEESNQALAEKCEIVIVSVPIEKTKKVLEEVGPFIKKGALFSHFTSVQYPAGEVMKAFPQCEIIGIHIMGRLSEKNKDLNNLNVVLTPVRQKKWLPLLKGLMLECKAKVSILDPLRHDNISALIQAAPHLVLFVFGHILRQARKPENWGIELKELEVVQTPIFQLLKITLGRILSAGSPNLYSSIQMANPQVIQMLTWCKEALEKFIRIIKENDENAFRVLYEELCKYYGKYHLEWAKEESTLALTSLQQAKDPILEKEESLHTLFCDLVSKAVDLGCFDIALYEKTGPRVVHPKAVATAALIWELSEYLWERRYEAALQKAKELIYRLKKAKGFFLDHNKFQALHQTVGHFLTGLSELVEMKKEKYFSPKWLFEEKHWSNEQQGLFDYFHLFEMPDLFEKISQEAKIDLRQLTARKKVLSLGFGKTTELIDLAYNLPESSEIIGVDSNEACVKQCQKLVSQLNPKQRRKIDPKWADCEELNFITNDSIFLVFCADLLDANLYQEAPEKFIKIIREIKRVMHPKGAAIIIGPDFQEGKGINVDLEGILLENGFKVHLLFYKGLRDVFPVFVIKKDF